MFGLMKIAESASAVPRSVTKVAPSTACRSGRFSPRLDQNRVDDRERGGRERGAGDQGGLRRPVERVGDARRRRRGREGDAPDASDAPLAPELGSTSAPARKVSTIEAKVAMKASHSGMRSKTLPTTTPSVSSISARPRLDDPVWAGEWTAPAGDDPLVLVGLGADFQDQEGLLRRIVVAVGELPVRAVVTTGQGIDPGSIQAPANVQIVRAAPHSEVLREAALAITHCGRYGVTIKALAAGVPLVCLPMGRDQLDVAARVVHAGAGVRLGLGGAGRDRGRRPRCPVRRLLSPRRPERIAAVIADETATDLAVAEIEAVVATAPRREAVTALATRAPLDARRSRAVRVAGSSPVGPRVRRTWHFCGAIGPRSPVRGTSARAWWQPLFAAHRRFSSPEEEYEPGAY